MSLFSLNFIALALVFVLVIRLNPASLWRSSVFLVANIVFLASFISDWWTVLPLAAFVMTGYLAALTLQRSASRPLLWFWVGALVLLFGWLRSYSLVGFLPAVPDALVTVGLSYILFRILHVLFDVYEGSLEGRIPVIDYLNFTLGFLSLVSGPIDRFQNFQASIRNSVGLGSAEIRQAFGRIALGFGKVLILSVAAKYLFDNLEPQMLEPSAKPLLKLVLLYCVCAASYTAFLYMNFSGYMDIVIGIGRLAGMAIPENFDKPFQSRNQIEFWGRWHMTLSNWFKQYAFFPILQGLMRRWPSAEAAPLLGVITYFVVFLMIGIWHGSTSIFVLYGFVLGLGVSLNKLWQVFLSARLGKKGYRELGSNPVYEYAARGLNIGYFMVALTAFWLSFGQLSELTARLGFVGWTASFVLLCALWSIVALVTDQLASFATGLANWKVYLGRVLQGRPAFASLTLTTAVLFACVAVQTMITSEPEFVYANF